MAPWDTLKLPVGLLDANKGAVTVAKVCNDKQQQQQQQCRER